MTPEIIFLQEKDKFGFSQDEITWSEDDEYSTDIMYIRADIVEEKYIKIPSIN